MNMEKVKIRKDDESLNEVQPLTEIEELIKEINKPKKQEKDIPEDLAYILGNFEFLKNTENAKKDINNYKRRFSETYKDLKDYIKNLGGKEIDDVNEIYSKYQATKEASFIIRRERPENVAMLLDDRDINIQFDPKIVADRGDKYANCAVWPYGADTVSGIRSAFNEGHTSVGPLVSVIAIKNNPENNLVEKPKDALETVGTLNREAVRIVSGKLTKKDLEFLIFRIPKDYLPKETLKKSELENNNLHVFRAFSF